jgi:hypothetical protein
MVLMPKLGKRQSTGDVPARRIPYEVKKASAQGRCQKAVSLQAKGQRFCQKVHYLMPQCLDG